MVQDSDEYEKIEIIKNAADLDSIAKEHRAFTGSLRTACWENSKIVPGRDPERWRYDAVGNVVARKLVGCEGVLCHEYDHIIPYSKGGKTEVENCQLLQTRVNRLKGADDNNPERNHLYSAAYSFNGNETL
ncbi:hypothetical protein O9G_005700 [Rozella allomycis CSF55]|uniref:HNH domain-containing protein n=1 Tax=Rozella allomycis (strain CSF55) TaxID=988480 RepID=A0A075AXY9_ROZAC|nr:hypothetical protein O9G_005700 [Rozella allomycis CSF55]|eukprot:EPZ35097.1 hypothetical protein O9G_005700 [Rozella allomycis CSF55]